MNIMEMKIIGGYVLYPFRYNEQIERYLSQFMRVLSGFQVEDGVERDGSVHPRRVKVAYGSVDRIVGSVLNRRDSFTNQTIPLIGFHLSGIQKDTSNKKNHHHEDYVAYQKTNGDHTAYRRLMGPSFILEVDVNIYASSHVELLSVLEQMLLIFNPRVTIQVDNNYMNGDYITDIILESISPNVTYPTGTERQVVQQTLSFSLPITLNYPVDMDASVIRTIKQRIMDEGGDTILDEITITGDDQ